MGGTDLQIGAAQPQEVSGNATLSRSLLSLRDPGSENRGYPLAVMQGRLLPVVQLRRPVQPALRI